MNLVLRAMAWVMAGAVLVSAMVYPYLFIPAVAGLVVAICAIPEETR